MKKSKKIIILTMILSVIIVIISLFTIHYFVHKKDVNDIESIEIITGSGFPRTTCRYKIDFLNESILHEIEDYDKSETFYTEFTKEQAENFIKKANLYGFFSWEKSYERKNVDDGKYVDVYIKFKDGYVKEIHCCNKFPLTYDIMAKVFEDTFGYNML